MHKLLDTLFRSKNLPKKIKTEGKRQFRIIENYDAEYDASEYEAEEFINDSWKAFPLGTDNTFCSLTDVEKCLKNTVANQEGKVKVVGEYEF